MTHLFKTLIDKMNKTIQTENNESFIDMMKFIYRNIYDSNYNSIYLDMIDENYYNKLKDAFYKFTNTIIEYPDSNIGKIFYITTKVSDDFTSTGKLRRWKEYNYVEYLHIVQLLDSFGPLNIHNLSRYKILTKRLFEIFIIENYEIYEFVNILCYIHGDMETCIKMIINIIENIKNKRIQKNFNYTNISIYDDMDEKEQIEYEDTYKKGRKRFKAISQ